MTSVGEVLLALIYVGIMIFAVGLVVVSVLVGIAGTFYTIAVTDQVTIHVTEKVGAHGDEGSYIVFADKLGYNNSTVPEEYIIEDNWFKGKFDASVRYHMIEPGHTYQCDTTGIRFQILSWYPNLVRCSEVGGNGM